MNVQYQINEKLKFTKENLVSKSKLKEKINSKTDTTDQSIKNIFTKNNLSFVNNEKDEKNKNEKEKINYLA